MKTRIDMIVFGLSVIACVLAFACIIQIRRYNAVQEEDSGPPIINHEAYAKWFRKVHGSSFHGNRFVNMRFGSYGTETFTVYNNTMDGKGWYRGQYVDYPPFEFAPEPEHLAIRTARAATNDTKQIVSIHYEYEDGSSFSWNKTNRVILK